MAYSTQKEIEKAILVGIIYRNKEDVNAQLKELERLAETAGVKVLGKTYQLIREVTPATLIGEGKVEEVKALIEENTTAVEIVIANC